MSESPEEVAKHAAKQFKKTLKDIDNKVSNLEKIVHKVPDKQLGDLLKKVFRFEDTLLKLISDAKDEKKKEVVPPKIDKYISQLETLFGRIEAAEEILRQQFLSWAPQRKLPKRKGKRPAEEDTGDLPILQPI